MAKRIDLLWIYAILFIMFLYGPVLLMPVFALNDGTFATFPLKGFTLKNFSAMAANTSMILAFQNSLRIAVSVAVLSTALGIPAALALSRFRLPGGAGVQSFMMLPLVIPSIVIAVALLVILLKILGIQLSLWTVASGHVLICLPFCMSVLMSRLEGFDPALEEASGDLGCTPWQTFWRLTFPLALPGVISSLLMGFIISFDEFVISFFLSGTETTLPVYLFSQLRFPNKLPGVLALGSLILVGSTVLVIAAEVIRKRGAASSNPGDL
ncbi:MAG: ABC transporter permease [Defluviimonas sp.]|uniref:ABC transporter permease n=1 Tax=Albidovulum sp. TaxID=1872424 RepID=UPI001DE691C8|nr:ABC transporter permease [Paracoccaceae bacterium]MCC0064152.1 ABC transporter permease [Defluviimonas sp.]